MVDATSTDVRKVIGNTAPDANIVIGWVDRIHKDVLHTSMYAFLNQSSQTVVTVAGTGTYSLTGNIRRVTSVFDRTFNRLLIPLEAGSAPVPTATHVAPPGGMQPDGPLGAKFQISAKTMGPWPEYYKLFGTSTLAIYPAPATSTWAGSLEVQSETQVADLANLTDVLVVPSDGKDLVVAGVNMLAFAYLKQEVEAGFWAQTYEKMKFGAPIQ